MKSKYIAPLFALTLILFACNPDPTPTETHTASATPLPSATYTATATSTPSPTSPLLPTDTPIPSPTITQVDLFPSGEIVYYSAADTELYLFDQVTGEHQQLTDAPGYSLFPKWSPDGRYISYLYSAPGADHSDLWLIDYGSGEPPRPLTDGNAAFFSVPAWSGDSRHLVYWGDQLPGDGVYIFTLDIQTGQITNLTPDYSKWNSHPAWSPDGSLIAFVSDRPEGMSDKIWVIDPNGENPTNLINIDSLFWEHDYPSWSPDSSEIAFFRSSFFPPEGEVKPGLWVVATDGSYERLIHEMDSFLPSSAPVWSPDASWIAFITGSGGETNIWVASSQGGTASQISNLPGEETAIAWSPDSQFIMFTHIDSPGYRTIYIATVDGSDPQVLFEGIEAALGSWKP